MIEVNLFRDKLVGLFGLAVTGMSSYRSLKMGGAKVIAWDDNLATRNEFLQKNSYFFSKKTLHSELTPLDDPIWNKIDILIVSPGVPTYFPAPHKVIQIAKSNNIKIICDIELLYRSCASANLIAITGTNGKSTTTSLIGHILRESNLEVEVGGNIGKASLELKKLRAGGNYVIECSSFQLELIDKFKPKISILLNITPDHLNRYKNLDDYINAKLQIFRNQNQGDIAVIGIDSKITRKIYEKLSSSRKFKKVIPFSIEENLEKGAFIRKNKIIYNFDDHIEINLPNNNSLLGDHNKENMLAGACAAINSGLTSKQIEIPLANFVGLAHRMEYLGSINSVSFINDSKATNPESTEKALKTYDNIIWIVGGYVKGKIDMNSLQPYYNKVKKAYLIGSSTKFLEHDFAGKLNFENAGNLANAFNKAIQNANKNDVILFSPSFASFDQFKNFEHRGECFRELFLNLR